MHSAALYIFPLAVEVRRDKFMIDTLDTHHGRCPWPIRRENVYVTGFGKTLRMGFFQKIEFNAWLISSTIELTCVQVVGLRPIVCLVVEIQRFVCDRATPPIIEKLRSKGVAMHAYGVSAYYRDPEIN